MVGCHHDEPEEAPGHSFTGLLVGAAAGLIVWLAAYWFFVWALAD